jgi:hypothetical protein
VRPAGMEQLELAVTVVRADFGPVVSSVARALLLHPGLRHAEITARCAPPVPACDALDDALAVLLTHGLAVAEAYPVAAAARRPTPSDARQLTSNSATGAADGVGRAGIATAAKRPRPTHCSTGAASVPNDAVLCFRVYMDRVLLRIRSGRFVRIARYQFGGHGMRISRLLIQRGRLTASDIVKVEYAGASGEEVDEAERTMIIMVKSGLLRWAGSTEHGPVSAGTVKIIYGDDDDDPSKKKGRENDSDDSDGWTDDGDDVDQNGGGHGRIDDEHAELSPDELNPMTPAYNLETKKVRVGQGFNARLVAAPLRENAKDAWMVCTWYLNKVLYNSCCSSVASALIGNQHQSVQEPRVLLAQKIFRAGLNVVSRMEDRDVTTSWDETGEVKLDAIQEELNTGGWETNDVDFRDAVQNLLHVSPPIARAVPEHAPDALVFYTGRMIALSRRQTVDDTLRDKHTIAGLRIWRSLAIHGCMQEKMISDKTMLVVKTVREYLYRLLRDGYVSMQEVPKSNEPARADRVAAVWYLWRADFSVVSKRLLDDTLRTTRRIMLKLEEVRATPSGDEPGADKKRATALKLLEASVYRCDDLVMVLRDFGPLDGDSFETLYRSEADRK